MWGNRRDYVRLPREQFVTLNFEEKAHRQVHDHRFDFAERSNRHISPPKNEELTLTLGDTSYVDTWCTIHTHYIEVLKSTIPLPH
jgi:hypothetical protein